MLNKKTGQTRLLRFVPFVHLPFSFRSLDLLVASPLFMKGIERIVLLGEKLEPLDCAWQILEVITLRDFRSYLHVAWFRLTPLLFAMC